MQKLFKIFTIALTVSLLFPACSSEDDFTEIVESSNLDTQATTGSEEDEVAKPGSNN